MENALKTLTKAVEKEIARRAYAIRKKSSNVVEKQNELIIQLLDQIQNTKPSETLIAENKKLKEEKEIALELITDLEEKIILARDNHKKSTGNYTKQK